MTPVSLASVAASLVSLLLSVWLLVSSHSAQGLQRELQEQQQALQNKQQDTQAQQQRLQLQQDQINTGNSVSNVAPQIIQAMGNAVIKNKNDKLRGVLDKYKISVSEKKADDKTAPAPSAPAPATPQNP
jgi:mannitol-specific phosphotransferase system IIBC component